jgi:hypothetical protein
MGLITISVKNPVYAVIIARTGLVVNQEFGTVLDPTPEIFHHDSMSTCCVSM